LNQDNKSFLTIVLFSKYQKTASGL